MDALELKIEKAPLLTVQETVEKGQSLAGATRLQLADALRALDVPERDLRMRSNQLWHWIYRNRLYP